MTKSTRRGTKQTSKSFTRQVLNLNLTLNLLNLNLNLNLLLHKTGLEVPQMMHLVTERKKVQGSGVRGWGWGWGLRVEG